MSSSANSDTIGTAQIGVTGLAVMGSNIARNFAHHGYTVAPLMDTKSFDELFRVRLLLEPAAASWAAGRRHRLRR